MFENERPTEHSIMPTFLQTHAGEDDLRTPADIDLYLRVSALHCRGLVIADSDLNNSELFHGVESLDKNVFWPGLRTGFLRRAARQDTDGSPVSQSAVAEGLRRVSPARAAKIPDSYLRRLDSVCSRVEVSVPPLTWSRTEVNRYSLHKLRVLLHEARDKNEVPEPHGIVDQVWDDVERHLDDGQPYGAADIETVYRPKDYESSAEWAWLWNVVLNAQAGNIPFVYKGQLAITTTPRTIDRFLPAGPLSDGVEQEVESEIYRERVGRSSGIRVTTRISDDHVSHVGYSLNRERLMELRLEEIEDLREEALGGEFFQARFDANGSGEDMLESFDGYSLTLSEYHERLARAGILRTRRLERAAIRETLKQVHVVAERYGETVELLMQSSSPLPVAEHNIVMCDSETIRNVLGQSEAKKILPDENALWVYRRPDYRVLELLAQSE